MQNLKIVMVITSLPLPFGGADSRWYYVLIKELVKRGHHVTVFIGYEGGDIKLLQDTFPATQYDLRCYPVHKFEPTFNLFKKIKTISQPYSYLFQDNLYHDLQKELKKPYDVLHLEQLWSGWLGLKYQTKSIINIHYLFSIDKSLERQKTIKSNLLRILTYRAEKQLLKAFPTFMTLSSNLANSVNKVNPKAQIYTVPLALDLSLYSFQENKAVKSEPIIGLIGSFNWTPSYLATERLLTRLWPAIKLRLPRAKLQIVGRSAKTSLAKFVGLPDVEFHQDVPDILPYFHNLDVMVYAPAFGSGMKVKIMESFALGLPVVTNANGVEGLPAVDGVHAGICEDDQGLVDRTVELIENADIYQQRRLQARQLLETHCSPEVVMEKLELVYQEICKISE